MSTLAIALVISATLITLAVFFQIKRRNTRKQRLSGLELRPNCLLTRYPIAFISGRQSVFRLFDHWNEVPSYLREHGYEVCLLEPSPRARVASLLKALDDMNEKCHLIADSSSRTDLEMIARAKHPNVASLTWVRNPSRAFDRTSSKSKKFSPGDLRPLEVAIEVFEVHAPHVTASGWMNLISHTLLALHNRLIAGRDRVVDALETCEIETREPWSLESRFLDLAISLAERDAQWSD